MEFFDFNNPLLIPSSQLHTKLGAKCTKKSLQQFVYLLILKCLPFPRRLSWYKRYVNATGFIRPSTTAELNTIKYITVEIINCIVSIKYESEVMITARPNHRPTRQECLLTEQFGNQTLRKCFISIFLTSSFQTRK